MRGQGGMATKLSFRLLYICHVLYIGASETSLLAENPQTPNYIEPSLPSCLAKATKEKKPKVKSKTTNSGE